ncbi:MAG: NUDIX hydrolase, partial [Chlamydiota bacterium]
FEYPMIQSTTRSIRSPISYTAPSLKNSFNFGLTGRCLPIPQNADRYRWISSHIRSSFHSTPPTPLSPDQYSSHSGKKPFAIGLAIGAAASTAGILAYGTYKPPQQTEPFGTRLTSYFDLLHQYAELLGPLGNAEKGEIEIVLDHNKIAEIEKDTGQKVGIIGENKWQIWVCDPVKFPNGTYGVYGRFFWKQAFKGILGSAFLPVLPDGKIMLISTYRHPLRKWVLEIPRGVGEGSESLLALIKRELKEETGAQIDKVTPLGKINLDSGITLGGIPLVKVEISKFGAHQRDAAETSISLHFFTLKELNDAIQKGYAPIKIQGKTQNVEIGTDAFMLSALKLNELNQKT